MERKIEGRRNFGRWLMSRLRNVRVSYAETSPTLFQLAEIKQKWHLISSASLVKGSRRRGRRHNSVRNALASGFYLPYQLVNSLHNFYT